MSIYKPAKQEGGWDGKGRVVGWWGGVGLGQAMAPQLVLSRGAILLTITSQGQQNALLKSRSVYIGQ